MNVWRPCLVSDSPNGQTNGLGYFLINRKLKRLYQPVFQSEVNTFLSGIGEKIVLYCLEFLYLMFAGGKQHYESADFAHNQYSMHRMGQQDATELNINDWSHQLANCLKTQRFGCGPSQKHCVLVASGLNETCPVLICLIFVRNLGFSMHSGLHSDSGPNSDSQKCLEPSIYQVWASLPKSIRIVQNHTDIRMVLGNFWQNSRQNNLPRLPSMHIA